MINKKLLNDLTQRICSVLPDNTKTLKQDFENNISFILKAGLEKFDLVSREEFDTQTAVLKRTQQKLDELQQKLDELEANIK